MVVLECRAKAVNEEYRKKVELRAVFPGSYESLSYNVPGHWPVTKHYVAISRR